MDGESRGSSLQEKSVSYRIAIYALGFWIITGDSHCYASALSDLLQYKVQINNMLKTCDGAAPQCQQCDQFVQDLSTACPQCMTQICNSCHKKSTTFHDDGSTFKCLKCSHSKTLNHPTSFYHNGKLGHRRKTI